MNISKIQLTVAVPIFNGGEALIDAIESCKNIKLKFNEFEILVVDNCSTDGKVEVIEENYGGMLPIRVKRNEYNCGRINNWNKCLEYAKGEYILFLFANDLIVENNSIEKAITLLAKNPDCSLVSAPWIYSDFQQTKQFVEPEFKKRSPGLGVYAAERHIQSVIESGKLPFVCLQSCFIKKSLIHQHGLLFDEKIPLTTDGVFLSALAMTTGKVGFIEMPTMIFRYNAPNRQHSNVRLHEHVEQMLKAFMLIQKSNDMLNIDLTLAFSNFSGLENAVAFLSKNFSIEGIKYLLIMRKSWKKSVAESDIDGLVFRIRIAKRFFLLPFRTLSYLFNYFLK